MRFRFCCTCEDDVKPKANENVENTTETREVQQIVAQAIITEQPKQEVSSIQLDRITEISVEEASTQAAIEVPSNLISTLEPQRVQTIKQDNSSEVKKEEGEAGVHVELLKKYLNLLQAAKEAENQKNVNPPNETYNPTNVTHSSSNQASNFSVDTTIDGEKLSFHQLAADLHRGTFKGSQFHIIRGTVQDDYFVFSESDKTAIKHVYNEAIKAMQLSMKELEGGANGNQAWNPPPGSKINTDYITRSGENAIMSFKFIKKGHFQSSYEGKDFVILNGRILADERFDENDRTLILQTYENTLLGMKRGLTGMQQRMQRMEEMQVQSLRGINPSYNLKSGRDTIRKMHSLRQNKRVSLLDKELIDEHQKPNMVIEDITDKFQTFHDEIDGNKLEEPVLQKTTFTPKAIIYDDPKTYEEQDKYEIPLPKPLDEYIISLDENFNLENRYHFHQARPKRTNRPKLNSKDRFRIESPERYSLFEAECLKLHNQYRKIHGVLPLVHNEFLSQVAKEWAEHLALRDAFYHRPKNEYGENLYHTYGKPCCAKMAVKAWYDEIDLYDYDNPKFSKEVGHFTQLVWKDTREVGTGVAQIGDKVWVCCNYHPPGNVLNKINDEYVPRPVMKQVKL